jgi:hypothetical protein
MDDTSGNVSAADGQQGNAARRSTVTTGLVTVERARPMERYPTTGSADPAATGTVWHLALEALNPPRHRLVPE